MRVLGSLSGVLVDPRGLEVCGVLNTKNPEKKSARLKHYQVADQIISNVGPLLGPHRKTVGSLGLEAKMKTYRAIRLQ